MQNLQALQTKTKASWNVFTFQESYPACVCELNYTVLTEKYLYGLLTWAHPLVPTTKKDYPENPHDPWKDFPVINVATFNLSAFFSAERIRPSMLVKNKKIPEFIEQYHTITGRVCSFAAHEHNNNCEILLTAPLPKFSKNGIECVEANEDNSKSKFFALLWHKGFLNEGQLSKQGILIGKHAREIEKFKSDFDKLKL